MRWTTADELTNAIEELDTTVHAGAPIAFSVRHCFAMVSDVVDLVWPEIERLRAENAAFRNAIRTGDGPSCEDVCLVECVGACGITTEESPC